MDVAKDFPVEALGSTGLLNGRDEGIALCLSGGGFRATLFSLGSIWRLNELGVLAKLKIITSVSGGSILSGYLGLQWSKLTFDSHGIATNFVGLVATPIQSFCKQRVAIPSAIAGILNPIETIGDEMTRAYTALYGNATLQALPQASPEFVIYATSLQTGRSVRMTRDYLADYMVGVFPFNLTNAISLAQAVAASSAFPPVLSPQMIKTDPTQWVTTQGATLVTPEWRQRLVLTDGGVYDNMGLEAAWHRFKTVLVSDAGAPFKPESNPHTDWVRQPIRVADVMCDQTRALRKRWLVQDWRDQQNVAKAGQAKEREGAYWGIRTQIGKYQSASVTPITTDKPLTQKLASIRTDLDPFSDQEQGWLINWGYALTDAAIRRWLPGLGNGPGTQPITAYPV